MAGGEEGGEALPKGKVSYSVKTPRKQGAKKGQNVTRGKFALVQTHRYTIPAVGVILCVWFGGGRSSKKKTNEKIKGDVMGEQQPRTKKVGRRASGSSHNCRTIAGPKNPQVIATEQFGLPLSDDESSDEETKKAIWYIQWLRGDVHAFHAEIHSAKNNFRKGKFLSKTR